MKKNVVFMVGAGLSKESGIATFRDSENGLWNNFKINEVCTSTAWIENPYAVQEFYNMRRKEVINAKPNAAHIEISEFQKQYADQYNTTIVSQNVDDLLERAGATNVIHVHGQIMKARSSDPIYDWMGLSHDPKVNNPKLYDVGIEGLHVAINRDENGFSLRPHIVFFGEQLIDYNIAVDAIEKADYLVIVGTSLNVFPVAGFPELTKPECQIYYVDPTDDFEIGMWANPTTHIKQVATVGVQMAIDEIILDDEF